MIRALIAKRAYDGWVVCDLWIYPHEVKQFMGVGDILLTTVPLEVDA